MGVILALVAVKFLLIMAFILCAIYLITYVFIVVISFIVKVVATIIGGLLLGNSLRRLDK